MIISRFLFYISENLTGLIEAATENNVNLVYALSPGLDISFSSSKDIQFLKRKLEQVFRNCKILVMVTRNVRGTLFKLVE